MLCGRKPHKKMPTQRVNGHQLKGSFGFASARKIRKARGRPGPFWSDLDFRRLVGGDFHADANFDDGRRGPGHKVSPTVWREASCPAVFLPGSSCLAPITGPPATQTQEERRASRRSPLRTFQTKLLSSGRSSVPCGGTDLKTPRRPEGAGAVGVGVGTGPARSGLGDRDGEGVHVGEAVLAFRGGRYSLQP